MASQEGATPAIADHQVRALLAKPDASTIRGLRDRAMLATFLYHGLRRAELCALRLLELDDHVGVPHVRIYGKGGKIRHVPLHPAAAGAITAYLEAAGHGDNRATPLFRPLNNNARDVRGIKPDGFYRVLMKYAGTLGSASTGSNRTRRAAAIDNVLEQRIVLVMTRNTARELSIENKRFI